VHLIEIDLYGASASPVATAAPTSSRDAMQAALLSIQKAQGLTKATVGRYRHASSLRRLAYVHVHNLYFASAVCSLGAKGDY